MSNEKNIKDLLESKEIPDRLSPENIKLMLDEKTVRQKKIKQSKNDSISHNIIRVTAVAAAAAITVGLSSVLFDNNQIIKEKSQNVYSEESEGKVYENEWYETLDISTMKYAESYEEIYDYFQIGKENIFDEKVYYEDGGFEEFADDMLVEQAVPESESENKGGFTDTTVTGSSDSTDYTNTYNQVDGVIEADIVKTDGERIFYCTDSEIHIANVKNGKFLSTETLEINNDIHEMYLYDDKLIVISGNNGDYEKCYEYDICAYESNTLVSVYDKESYELLGKYEQSGYYNDVRLTENGYLYLISNKDMYDIIYNDGIEYKHTDVYVPTYSVNGNESLVACDEILISKETEDFSYDNMSYINISSLNLNSDNFAEPCDVKSIAGVAGEIYCSLENLYITYGYNETQITRFKITDGQITPKAGTSIKGWVNDQFSMDEKDGYFRIAVTVEDNSWLNEMFHSELYSKLYVLDMNLNVVGKTKNFGEDETIRSVNFDGDIAYIVTFMQTDPLFAFDLSDPKNPVETDALKITGYSSYMQNWTEGKSVGFGESGDERGNLNGIKLSMFDNSDKNNLKVIDCVEIKSNDYSDDEYAYISSVAVYDRKALLIDPERNIIAIPVNNDVFTDYECIFNSSYYYVYSFADDEFNLLGKVGSEHRGYYNSDEIFDRIILIDNYAYIMADNAFKSVNLENFAETYEYKFAVSDTYIYSEY